MFIDAYEHILSHFYINVNLIFDVNRQLYFKKVFYLFIKI